MIYLRDSVYAGEEYKVINGFYSLDSTPMQSSCLKWLHEWFIRCQVQVYKYADFKTRTRRDWLMVRTSFWGRSFHIKLSEWAHLLSNYGFVGFHTHLGIFSAFHLKIIHKLSTENYVKKKHLNTKVETQSLKGQLKFSCLQRIPE